MRPGEKNINVSLNRLKGFTASEFYLGQQGSKTILRPIKIFDSARITLQRPNQKHINARDAVTVCSGMFRTRPVSTEQSRESVNIDQCHFAGGALAPHCIFIDNGYKSLIQLGQFLKTMKLPVPSQQLHPPFKLMEINNAL